MSGRTRPNVFSIAPGLPFLTVFARALLSGELIEGFRLDGDPLKLADTTIYVPTRRAARELRSVFVELSGARSAILPVIRPLGEFDDDDAEFDPDAAAALDAAPPIAALDRLLTLAPLVRAWKRRLPAHVAAMFAEEVVVPASTSDSIWLARDLAALMDEIETEGSDWSKLSGLVGGDFAGWWQVTLDFLEIVTAQWPHVLRELDRSNPAAHRSSRILAEAERLRRNPPLGPVIAAGSTGSIPATAQLLSAIAHLPLGALVLPGLDKQLDARSWSVISGASPPPAVLGHPQYGLSRLIAKLGVTRADVVELATPPDAMAIRAQLVSQALRPAETTDEWAGARGALSVEDIAAGLAGITLLEAANERDEAIAIAVALRCAIQQPGHRAALVTGDRELARRVSAELQRFGIQANDSGGRPLLHTPPGELLTLMLEAVFRPGDPVSVLSLLKHPLLNLGLDRKLVRHAVETIELVALRGGTGRPDIATLPALFEQRFAALAGDRRAPFWMDRIGQAAVSSARAVLARLVEALAPLSALRSVGTIELGAATLATVTAFEGLGRGDDGGLVQLYQGAEGEKLAELLRSVIASTARVELTPPEWPDVMVALVAPETVKPAPGADDRISIWGALEARLQSVDTLVIGGLNEGSWPRKAEPDRFLSRMMKTGLDLDPPERRIGLAAHDFTMAMGAPSVVLTRSARAGDAPSTPSRWIQRLLTFIGSDQASSLRARGDVVLGWARGLDMSTDTHFARPNHAPPLDVRPTHLSITEIETLRRDPYAFYARRVLGLQQMDPLVRDPGAAERGNLFHDILHAFTSMKIDPSAPDAPDRLVEIARTCFAAAALPTDIEAIWWPRFAGMAANIIAWEKRDRTDGVTSRHAEIRASAIPIGATGKTLSGRADRIDLRPAGMADILDYKTGTSPSRAQAHTLLAPQLALEGALMKRGAFSDIGPQDPSQLAYVRLKANGEVEEESILEYNRKPRSAADLSADAWSRLEALVAYYDNPAQGYLSRALPFREGDTSGAYDHLARVLEWSAGGEGSDESGTE